MFHSTFLLTADLTSIGRLDISSIPDQTLMELLAEHLDDKKAFQDPDGIFKDISTWGGLSLSTNEEVSAIAWETDINGGLFGEDPTVDRPVGPGGSMDLKWIPSTVIKFCIPDLELTGSVDTITLPRDLCDFDIANNHFSGTFDVENLPRTLHDVNIASNEFSGSLSLERLPSSIISFYAENNGFTGTLDLTCLPSCLAYLFLSNNSFTGTIDLQALPFSISYIRLEENLMRQSELKIQSDLQNLSSLALDKDSFETLVGSDGKPIEISREFKSCVEIRFS